MFTDKPIVGCAKKTLLPYHGKLGTKRGSKLQVIYDNRTVGYVLRTQDNVKPIFVSPGHRISLQNSVKIVLMLPGNYRVPDPLRHADHAARNHCKGKAGEWYDLGILD